MSSREERLEILKMVRDGVISAEEGERLLDALAAGDCKERQEDSPLGEMGRGFAEVGRGFAGVGKTIAVAVDQAVRSALRRSDSEPSVLKNLTEIDLPEGCRLEIENVAVGEGSITLEAGPGRCCRIRGEAEHEIDQDDDRARILWPGGDLIVVVPETVARATAAAHHGHIRTRGIAIPLGVETLHGHLDLRQVRGRIEAETLAGNVVLEAGELHGKSEITTMAGAIEIFLTPAFSGVVRASSLGGDIHIEPGLGSLVQRPLGQVPRSAILEVGGTPDRATLEIETAGGSIAIRSGR